MKMVSTVTVGRVLDCLSAREFDKAEEALVVLSKSFLVKYLD